MNPLEKRIHVRCDLAHAFEVFTARIDLWWPPSHRKLENSEMQIEPFVGGRFYERDASGQEHVMGEVRAWEAPARICYSWRPGSPAAPTEVEVRFWGDDTRDNEGTWVHVTHRPGPTGDEEVYGERVALFERAWTHVLASYADRIAADESA